MKYTQKFKLVIWKDIKDFPNYMISEFGDIMSFKGKRKLLKYTIKASGFKYYVLYNFTEKGRYLFKAHVLVAKTFLRGKHLKYVNHIDGDRSNNHHSNLIWSNRKEIEDKHTEWRVVPGYPSYKVSKDGRVKSFHSRVPIIMKPYMTADGYCKLKLRNENKTITEFSNHRLVAICYIPNPKDLPLVDHKNGIRNDNRLSNLRWSTYSDNSKNKQTDYNGARREIIQKDLKGNIITTFRCSVDASKALNNIVGPSAIRKCANGGSNTSAGYIWEYKNDDWIFYNYVEGEIFKPIIGDFGSKGNFDFPNYKISNYGTVVNERELVLKRAISNGYHSVRLSNKKIGKSIRVHVLVALFFVEGRTDERWMVNHIDEDRLNPRADNLEWSTPRENFYHTYNKKSIKT